MVNLISYDGQSDIKRYQELAQRCVFDDNADVVMAVIPVPNARPPPGSRPQQGHLLAQQPGRRRHRRPLLILFGPHSRTATNAAIKCMIDHFGTRLIYIGADYNFCRAIGMWTRVAAGLNGGTIEMEEYFPFGVSQWQATIDKIQK